MMGSLGKRQRMRAASDWNAYEWWRARLGDIGFAWAASDDRGFVRRASRRGGFGDDRGPLAYEHLRVNAACRPGGEAAEGSAPRPSSQHANGVLTTVFCDGRGQTLSSEVDLSVYIRLLTPNGSSFGQEELVYDDF